MLDSEQQRAQARPGRHRPRAHWGMRLGIAFLLVAGLLVAVGFNYYSWCEKASGPTTAVTFTVPEGASGGEVVDALHRAGVIRCGLVSKWLLRKSGKQDEIRTGRYRLTMNMTPAEAFDVLTTPPKPVPTVRLTIPEGYRITQIAERVQQVLHIPVKTFMHAIDAGNWSLPPYLPKGKKSPEGFLFPNTFQFGRNGSTADDVIRRLLDDFRTEAAQLPWQNAKELGVTDYQVVVIASMIEKEAKLERDRPLIAAVIYNRLKRNMVLGIDATLLYVLPDRPNGLTSSDLEIHSPYNTRISPGLPPTPIASPGLPSLRAALNPAHVPYLYYVLCGADGHHKFSVTPQQFERDKAACLG